VAAPSREWGEHGGQPVKAGWAATGATDAGVARQDASGARPPLAAGPAPTPWGLRTMPRRFRRRRCLWGRMPIDLVKFRSGNQELDDWLRDHARNATGQGTRT